MPSKTKKRKLEGAWGHKPPEPARVGAEEYLKMPRGWTPEVWHLRCALLMASRRLQRGTGLQCLLEGTERYVKLTGRGRHGPGPGPAEAVTWWADVQAMVQCVARVGDTGTLLLLGPWLVGTDRDPAKFRPFGG